MSLGIITQQLRCNRCSRELPQWRAHSLSGHSGVICEECLEAHMHALEVLGGAMPRGCQECGLTREELELRDRSAALVKFYVVPKDGILQLLCHNCKDAYVTRRADLYRGTAYGHQVLQL